MMDELERAARYVVGIAREYDKTIAESHERSSRAIANAVKNATDASIKARDRVDISLEEYESMKKCIENLKSLTESYERLFYKIKIPLSKDIDVDSVKVSYSEHVGNPLDCTHKIRYRIEFDIIDAWK